MHRSCSHEYRCGCNIWSFDYLRSRKFSHKFPFTSISYRNRPQHRLTCNMMDPTWNFSSPRDFPISRIGASTKSLNHRWRAGNGAISSSFVNEKRIHKAFCPLNFHHLHRLKRPSVMSEGKASGAAMGNVHNTRERPKIDKSLSIQKWFILRPRRDFHRRWLSRSLSDVRNATKDSIFHAGAGEDVS